jgi:hypothetical protein
MVGVVSLEEEVPMPAKAKPPQTEQPLEIERDDLADVNGPDQIDEVLTALRALKDRVSNPVVHACLDEASNDIAHLMSREGSNADHEQTAAA